MNIDVTNSNYKVTKKPYKKTDTIIIDNGTYEMKGGYIKQQPQIIFRNEFYKDIEGIKFIGTGDKYRYTPFTNDMISGFHVLEENIDQVLEHLKIEKCKNLIFVDIPYNPLRKELIQFLFDVYRFEKIQVGIDAIYSYFYNKQDPNTIIIDASHSATYVYLMIDSKINALYKICYVGKLATKYLSNVVRYKSSIESADFSALLPHLRCAFDYNKDVVDIFERIKAGNFADCIFIDQHDKGDEIDDFVDEESSEDSYKAYKKKILARESFKNQKNTDNDEKTEKLSNAMYKIRIYQISSRINKLLSFIESSIEKNEDKFEKMTDFKKFLEKKKQKYENIVRDLELRNKYRRDSKNRKAYEFTLLMKTGELTEEEKLYKKKIEEAEYLVMEERIIAEKNNLLKEIMKYDPTFSFSSSNTLDLITGSNLNRVMVNIDLLRAVEVLFEPSQIGLNQMGLGEILEKILATHKIKNIFITGGFSRITGFKERIQKEANMYSYDGEVTVSVAEDPAYDSFNGAFICDLFPVYSYKDYKKKGIDVNFQNHL